MSKDDALILRKVGTAVIAVVVLGVLIAVHNHHGSSSSSTTDASATVDPTMGARSRTFVTQFRDCQKGVRALGGLLGGAGSLDTVALATDAHEALDICQNVRDDLATDDTTHFDDQALDAEVAVDQYVNGIKKVADYIDTETPSDIPEASDNFSNASSAAATAIAEINARRQIYGFGNL